MGRWVFSLVECVCSRALDSAARVDGSGIANAKDDAWEEWDATLEDTQYQSKLLLSLDAALLAVAGQHGFDVQCVYHRARAKPYKPTKVGVTADAEIQATWTNIFNMILESSFG